MISDVFFAYSWHIDKNETETTVIRVYGLGEKNENVCIRIIDFKPYVYLELDPSIDWENGTGDELLQKIDKLMGRDNNQGKPDRSAIDIKLKYKKKLYYANENKLFPFLLCHFNHTEDIRTLSMKIRYPIYLEKLRDRTTLCMHENNASPILQLTSQKKLPVAGWIKFKGKLVDKKDQITYCDKEYIVKYETLIEKKSDTVAKPLLMGYDIEVYSSVPSAMPDANRPEDKIFQISCIFSRQGKSGIDKQEKYLLTLGKPDSTLKEEKIIVRTYKTEYDLLLGFVKILKEKQPNICIGYNIFGFDIPYMIKRAENIQCIGEFDKQGFLIDSHAEKKSISWSSSAYKNQSFEFLDAEGRIFVDLLPLVRRDYKLNDYKLSTIALHFLKNIEKDPLDARGIFRCYELGMKGDSLGKQAISLVGKYCIKDSVIVVKLFEILTTWIALCEMAKVTGVPIFSLYTQGQQIKIFSQVYKKATHENIVVERNAYIVKDTDYYVGATVFPPKPGIYDKVTPMDFSSLYPSIIIAYNLCWSTLVTDDNIPDSECNVMEWEDHVGCIHDPKIIRKNELIAIIKKEEEKIKLLRNERDKKENKQKKNYYKELIEQHIKNLKPTREERSVINKCKPKHIICCKRKYRWLKSPIGVLPEILTNLMETRTATKKLMKDVKTKLKELKEGTSEYEDLNTYYDVLDQRQLALKISCNSGYGVTGARKGYLTFMPVAMCTTYMGRISIEKAANSIQKEHKGVLVYGDSVTGDTPVIIKYPNDTIDIKCIDNLVSEKDWVDYEVFKNNLFDNNSIENNSIENNSIENKSEKEYALTEFSVWCNGVWSKIKKVIRHKTKKTIYRVLTHNGCVDVTEDHSLLTKDVIQIKPCDVKVGDELLHSFPEIFEEYDTNIIEGEIQYKNCQKCKEKYPIYEFYQEYNICKKCVYICNNRNKTDKKEYYSEYEYLHNSYILTKEEAFVWGFFMADGSGGKYKSGKYSWAINNQNLDYLNRAKKYLEKIEKNFEFKILDTMKSSNVYKLVPKGKVRLMAEKYHQLFYDKNKYKIVPYPILNSSQEIKEWFFEGYYTGDGSKTNPNKIIPDTVVRMDCKGKIGSQGLFYLLKSLGYNNVNINTRYDKTNIFRINATKDDMTRKNPFAIKKIYKINSEYNDCEEYVYDLETEQGVFQAGIGSIVVKNTDSNYVSFPHLNTSQECWDHAVNVAKKVSELFPKPMSLAFEEKLYWRFLILTKKRYMSLACERDGKLDNKISKRGVLLSRRDNCAFVRKVYGDVVMKIFNGDSKDSIFFYILEEFNKACAGVYSYKDFIITKSVGRMDFVIEDNRVVLHEETDDKGKIIYKLGDYKVKKLPEDEKKRRAEFKKKNCTTEEEYYLRCLPAQAQLAERMRKRGQIVPAGSRIEYVLTTNGGHTAKQYIKAEDAEYFGRHVNSLSIDYLYYIKQLVILDQVLNVIFNPDNNSNNSNNVNNSIISNNVNNPNKDFVLNQYKFRSKYRMKLIEQIKNIAKPKLIFN